MLTACVIWSYMIWCSSLFDGRIVHISRVASSCIFQLRRLRQIRRSAGEEDTKRVVTALVLSRLDYCNFINSHAFSSRPSDSDPACTEHRCSFHHRHQYRPHHSSSDMLTLAISIKLRFIYKLCHLMHLIHINQRPHYTLTGASSSRCGLHRLRFASHLLYRKPKRKCKFGERAVMPAAWNSLSDYIQSDLNTNLSF